MRKRQRVCVTIDTGVLDEYRRYNKAVAEIRKGGRHITLSYLLEEALRAELVRRGTPLRTGQP